MHVESMPWEWMDGFMEIKKKKGLMMLNYSSGMVAIISIKYFLHIKH